jgi:chromosome partitioning protein
MKQRANKVVAVANQKGGVGKTTTSVNLAACLADSGCTVLLVDIDPQGNASSGLGVHRDEVTRSSYHVLNNEVALHEAVIATQHERLFLLPATTDLAGAEIELVDHPDREFQLRRALQASELDVDFIILDCPPSLGLLTVNALVAASTVLLPVQTEYYALEGMGQLLHTVNLVHQHLNPELQIEGILLTMYDGRTNLSEQVADEVTTHFGNLVFETVIPRNVRLSEAPSHGKSIIAYDDASRGARRYRAFAREFLDRNQKIA